MNDLIPAVAFAPGEYLKEALEQRGWSQIDFAEIIGRTPKLVNEIINAKTAITPTTAQEIAAALGGSAMVWLNLEAAYRLHGSPTPEPSAIAKRAAIRRIVPLRAIIARGWITQTDDVDEMRARIEVFRGAALEQPVSFDMAAKKTVYGEPLTPEQEAWLLRAKKLAETLLVSKYSSEKLEKAVEEMKSLRRSPDDAYIVPKLLADAGIRFVVVERLPGLGIDGACFWLAANKPVIVMSLRYDRIDNFWFVLRHEIEHVLNGDGQHAPMLDSDLELAGRSVSHQEERANTAAADFCVPSAEMDDWMVRKIGLFTDANIRQFASTMGIHSGLVAGQLRRRLSQGPLGEKAWKLFASHLARIKHVITSTALVDGFGSTPQVG